MASCSKSTVSYTVETEQTTVETQTPTTKAPKAKIEAHKTMEVVCQRNRNVQLHFTICSSKSTIPKHQQQHE